MYSKTSICYINYRTCNIGLSRMTMMSDTTVRPQSKATLTERDEMWCNAVNLGGLWVLMRRKDEHETTNPPDSTPRIRGSSL